MKKIIVFALIAWMGGFSLVASAGSATGKISSISIRNTGNIIFKLTRKSSAICARNSNGGYYISSLNPEYKSLYAALLSAQAQDLTVTGIGNNVCTWPGNEDVLWIVTSK